LFLIVEHINFFYSASAKVGTFDGNDFLQYCVTTKPDKPAESRDEQDRVTYCAGYMEGSVTIIAANSGRVACIPKDTTPLDIYKATADFLDKHPDQKQHLLASVVFAAVSQKWPCR
jgi:hypothetical protein